MQAPTLISCGDGGLQGAFIAGAMSRVVEHFPENARATTHILATSASMASMVYYLSHMEDHGGLKLWTQDLPNSSFLSFTSFKSLFSSKPVYDIPHMVDVVMKQNRPLNLAALRTTPFNFVFPILNIDTRQVELFSNQPALTQTLFPSATIRNWQDYDIYELTKAACAIPILFDRPITIGNHRYCDAGLITPFLVPDTPPANIRALYVVVRTRAEWKNDLKIMLAAAIWRVRAIFGKTGLPGWVYTQIMRKPLTIQRLTHKLSQTIPNLTIISATTPLMSSLQNTPESALHNWRTGEAHIDARQTEIATNFWKI